MTQIPTGKYTVRIEYAGKLTAKSGKEYWQVNYQIVDGDYSGRIINILFWDEPSFFDHINAVQRYIKSQGLSCDEFDLDFERSDNAKKYNRLMPKLG